MKKKLNSLRWRLVMYVFFIMILANFVTGGVYILLIHLGVLERTALAHMMGPVWLMLLSGVVGTIIAAWIGKYYLSSMKDLIKATERVAKGDFSVRLPVEKNSEMGALMLSFNRMVRDLGSIEMFRNDFINDFSHEFKTPIVSIRGFAKQLQRDDITDEERKEYATIIANEAQRLTNLSTNILLLSKLENQQILTAKTDFRLDEQLRTSILLLEKEWMEKNLELEIELDEATIHGNAEMLSQVWVNLLSNAIKFTPAGGKIGVFLHRREQAVEVTVQDNGIGMDPLTKSHIFEKFYQGENSHSAQGNGLGLAMVKRVVELSSGKIRVESTEGVGSTFTVTLPIGG